MLLCPDDTVRPQSEAVWEKYWQRGANANAALAVEVISAASHVYKQHKKHGDGFTALTYEVAHSM